MSFALNKLSILCVISISFLTICWQAHAPDSASLGSPEGDEKVKSMKNDIDSKLEHIESVEKLDFSKIPTESRGKVTKLIEILKAMKIIILSPTDLQNVEKAQLKWQEVKAIFPQMNLNGRHAKPNGELVTKLKSLFNEVDSNNSDSDIVAERNKLRATFEAFKKKLGLSSKALSTTKIPKDNAARQSSLPGAGKAQPENKQDEMKESLAVAVEALSGYIDRFFTEAINRFKKETVNPRRRRKRGLVIKFLNVLMTLIVWITVLIAWGFVCICTGVGPILWAYFEFIGDGSVCTTIGRDLTLVFLGRTQHG
ncbi:hypothetical protein DdX_14290 [Ditylenchus destructor]|uniref:Uncharacterized protein n=1 Tax=Ditylenchus destructor TaxID=166010 RepID=A0AAD4MT26_9BILA|nr:hypothetical protein DdX_14290 [Ditylenchus destructor]